MFVFLDGNLAAVKRLLIPLDVRMDFGQRGRVGVGFWGGVTSVLCLRKKNFFDHSIRMLLFCYRHWCR